MANNGGPAFPRNQPGINPNQPGGETWLRERGMTQEGMTLRDWFAGQALAGILGGRGPGEHFFEELAKIAYKTADAMLAERGK